MAVENYSIKIGRSRAGSTFHHTNNLLFYSGPETDVSGGSNHGWVIRLNNDPNDSDSTSLIPLWDVVEPVVFHIPNVTLAPGESIVYSPPAGHNSYEWPSQTGSLSPSTNQLLPGFRPQWSYYYPLPFDAPLGHLLLDDDDDEWTGFDEYILYQFNQSRIIGINFSQGTADNPTHLMDIVHLTTQNPITPPIARMNPFPGPLPFTNDVREAAPGLFFQRKYTDNAIDVDPNRLRARNQWLAHHNPRAATQGSNPFFYTLPAGGEFGFNANPSNNPSFISFADRFNDNQGIPILSGGRVSVGLSENSSIERAILFEAPPSRETLHSIGQLQHAPLYRWSPFWQTLTTDLNRLRARMNSARYDNLIPTYAIGNSLADPRIPLGERSVQWPVPSTDPNLWGVNGIHYDYSYLLNESLWDDFFFSTLPASSADPQLNPENQRLLSLSDHSVGGPVDFETSASRLLVRGSFNVNSTSEQAWRALLASFWGQSVLLADGSEVPGGDFSPVLRFNRPIGGQTGAGNFSDPSVYDGFTGLNRSQIEALAAEMVRQVKLRGPVNSLSDFVNRSLDSSDDEFRRSGALASALQRSQTNDSLQEPSFSAITSDDAFPSGVAGLDAISETGWRTSGLPGWLTQADILSRLGSMLNVRSDTFKIRGYGESTDPTTGQVSRAWAEVVVQRKPYYIDSLPGFPGIDSPEIKPSDLTSQNNISFGRKFEVISFRWLDVQEL